MIYLYHKPNLCSWTYVHQLCQQFSKWAPLCDYQLIGPALDKIIEAKVPNFRPLHVLNILDYNIQAGPSWAYQKSRDAAGMLRKRASEKRRCQRGEHFMPSQVERSLGFLVPRSRDPQRPVTADRPACPAEVEQLES